MYGQTSTVPQPHRVYARMALLAYQEIIDIKDIPADWSLILDSKDLTALQDAFAKRGFRGLVFAKDEVAVVSIRGTDNWQNVKDDKYLYLGNVPTKLTTYKAAEEFLLAAGIKQSVIVFTGHSLGGAVAEMLAHARPSDDKISAITFESPGFKVINSEAIIADRFIHYLSRVNIINTCYEHIGEVRRLQLQLPEDTFDHIRTTTRKLNQTYFKQQFFQDGKTGLTKMAVTSGIEKVGMVNDLKKSHSIQAIVDYLETSSSVQYQIEALPIGQSKHITSKVAVSVKENTSATECRIL